MNRPCRHHATHRNHRHSQNRGRGFGRTALPVAAPSTTRSSTAVARSSEFDGAATVSFVPSSSLFFSTTPRGACIMG